MHVREDHAKPYLDALARLQDQVIQHHSKPRPRTQPVSISVVSRHHRTARTTGFLVRVHSEHGSRLGWSFRRGSAANSEGFSRKKRPTFTPTGARCPHSNNSTHAPSLKLATELGRGVLSVLPMHPHNAHRLVRREIPKTSAAKKTAAPVHATRESNFEVAMYLKMTRKKNTENPGLAAVRVGALESVHGEIHHQERPGSLDPEYPRTPPARPRVLLCVALCALCVCGSGRCVGVKKKRSRRGIWGPGPRPLHL